MASKDKIALNLASLLSKLFKDQSLKQARFSKPKLIIFAAAFALIGGYAVYRSFAATPTTANLWVDTNGGTCTRQSIAGSYNDTQACVSFDAAWDAAATGDTIVIKSGTYGAQTITGNKTAETSIIGEEGAITGAIDAQADFTTLENITVDVGSAHGQSSGGHVSGDNVTFRDVKLHGAFVSLLIEAGNGNTATNFTWHRGSLGENGTTGGLRSPACDGGNGDGEPIWIGGDGATIEGVRINPQKADGTPRSCSSNGFHLEHIRIQESSNVTIKNNWFVSGGDIGSGWIFVTSAAPSVTANSNLKIINNAFGDGVDGTYSMQVHSNVTSCANWIFAYNTFVDELPLLQCDDTTGMQWIGNLGAKRFGGCDSGASYIKNVWQDDTNTACGSDTWVNGPDAGIGNLGIDTSTMKLNAGSSAIDAAEAAGASDFCTGELGSVDFEGTVRPQGATCDAGSDEFGAGGGGTSDSTVPTVSITTPSNNAAVSGPSVTLSADASDNVGVVGVQFKVDGTNVSSEDNSSPYSIVWNSATVSNGNHSITAVARDAAGNSTTSGGINVTVDNGPAPDTSPPSVPQNTTYTGDTTTTIGLSWSASTDNIAVTGYRLYLNGSAHDTTTSLNFTYTGLTCGTSYTIGLTAYDAAGNESNLALNTGTHSTVACDSVAPTISITAPANGATVSGASVTLSASASDNVGVTGVQFKLNGFDQGAEDTSAPYSTVWDTTTLGNGTHTITAVARDAAGNTTTSGNILITVNNPTPPSDTTAPTTPANLRTTSTTTSSILLTWDASSDSGGAGLSGYHIYRNGSLLTTVIGLNHTDSGLSAGTSYSYTVSAIDNAGNESAQSAALNTSTSSNTPPSTSPATPAKLGDLNSDNTVNIFDLSILLSRYGGSGLGDLNNDNTVNIFDLSILLSRYGG